MSWRVISKEDRAGLRFAMHMARLCETSFVPGLGSSDLETSEERNPVDAGCIVFALALSGHVLEAAPSTVEPMSVRGCQNRDTVGFSATASLRLTSLSHKSDVSLVEHHGSNTCAFTEGETLLQAIRCFGAMWECVELFETSILCS